MDLFQQWVRADLGKELERIIYSVGSSIFFEILHVLIGKYTKANVQNTKFRPDLIKSTDRCDEDDRIGCVEVWLQ
jgi:hypothetical protein